MNEERRELAQRHGDEAKALLESELFQSALAYLEAEALRLCQEATTPEDSFRGSIRYQEATLFRQLFVSYVKHGEDAAAEILRETDMLRQNRAQERRMREHMAAAKAARAQWDAQKRDLKEQRNG